MKTSLKNSKWLTCLIVILFIVPYLFAQEVPIFLLRTFSMLGVNSIDFSPNGKMLASASSGNITLWGIENGNKLWEINGDINATNPSFYLVNCIAFNPDGQTLASAGGDEKAKIWDVRTGREIRTLKENSQLDVESLVFSPDGSILALGRDNGIGNYSIELWDVQTGRQLQTPMFKNYYINASCIAISPDSKIIAGVVFESKNMDNPIKLLGYPYGS